ncbi:serine/threonine protein kinase PrkT [Barrientosiimonas marina]|uniref:Protein kinase n=1 Tax=Lentibacillus kimchii TaxID=1542911 RepID=A0ABW2UTE0_9BACI
MKQTWKKQSPSIRPGTVITGKWHQRRYTIQKKLGQGAVGTVYLCVYGDRQAALKISDNSTSMMMEVNVLKSLEKVQGTRLGPSLIDVDDWTAAPQKKYAFYVMEFLQGEPLGHFIKKHGSKWIGVLLLQLLDDLERLHQAGWVFGDLKTDNLLVLAKPPKIRWIDVGGTTKMGRSIKEYTEFYDRGYWGMGSRKAEPSYDLFALAMVFLTLEYPNHFQKGTNPKATLMKKINDARLLRACKAPLKKALLGYYSTSAAMRRDVIRLMTQKQSRRRHSAYAYDSKTAPPAFAEGSGIFLAALFYYVSSLFVM